MARLSRKELEDIVTRDMPGYRLARGAAEGEERTAEDAAGDRADATTPSLGQLRHKYLFDKYGAAEATSARLEADRGESAPGEDSDDEDQIVTVEPAKAAPAWDVSAARPKVVVVSGREKRIVGRQG